MISNEYQVKLCDFGFARFIDKNQPQKAVGGSKGFTAPEIYQPTVKDLTKCDVFSLGVVFFIMVTGYPPFQTNNPYEEDVWWSMIQDQRFQQYWENWSKQIPIPEGFTDVIEYMLHPDDTKRLAIAELL
jgi:serine/threonine-protein kinase ULK/ATG1/calcium/calmodulin-dependent protein kinase I